MVGVPVIQHIAGDPALHKDGSDIIFMDGDLRQAASD